MYVHVDGKLFYQYGYMERVARRCGIRVLLMLCFWLDCSFSRFYKNVSSFAQFKPVFYTEIVIRNY